MFLIVGLGNPGRRFEHTRHNVGFDVVDTLAREAAPAWVVKFDGLLAKAEIAGQTVLLLKPQTFMNRSGESVSAVAQYFRIELDRILVVHDELDLPLGTVRLKLGGGDAGHRGLRSTTGLLGSAGYGRLRIGIGRPPPDFDGPVADYVLEAFPPSDLAQLNLVLGVAAIAVRGVVESGFSATMNRTNQRPSGGG